MHAGRLSLAMLLALAGAGQDVSADPPEGLTGLLSPAMVASGPPGCVRIDTRERLALRSGPTTDSPRIGWLGFAPWRDAPEECDVVSPYFTSLETSARDPVPTLESSYEVVALLVLEKRGEWLRLDLGSRSGWLRRPTGYRHEPYPELLPGKLAYATQAWSGEVCAAAGADCRKFDAAPEQPMNVLSVALEKGIDWIEVEITNDSCRGEAPLVHVRGWIRARADEKPTVWFHSRGC